ncbi:MAG: TonB-dependent receptor [Acidobacteria bacterium]|nr:TonB-dependent receptor [Acidobacteriota bacterium]
MRRVIRVCVVLLFLIPCTSLPVSAQITTGSLIGAVTDETGAVMPGVTVTLSGETLIGGPQVEVTAASGQYRFERLPPGVYNVRFELPGFTSIERMDLHISATFTATVNVKMQVGQMEERITVTGESPIVDTKSNVQQTAMGQEVLEGIPTGRDVWSLAKLIPGVSVGTYDVGGTQGMQQSAMSAHGSRDADKTFAIDGLSVNWPGTGGGSTMVYYDQGMFEEINYQTSAIPAEVAIGGIFMNMVTKAGGNAWRGEARYYYANDDLQSENFDAVSKQFSFKGGNPVADQYDFNGTMAGPIVRDKIWFFGSYRRWKVDKLLLSTFNPDGSNARDDNLIWNASVKLTSQIARDHRLGLVYNFNQKNRYQRRTATFEEDKATFVQLQPGYTGQAKYTAVLNNQFVFESTAGGVKGVWPLHYQKEVAPTDIRREDTVLQTGWDAAPRSYDNPNYRFQWDNVISHTRAGRGTHSLKAGVQFTRQFYRDLNTMNGDMRLIYNNGRPFRVQAFNTPVQATSYVHQLGFFAQDSWSMGRFTLNVGVRADGAKGWIPEETSGTGRWVAERTVEKRDVYNQWIGVWRAGAVFDLTGKGLTAVKGNYSRYAHQVGAAAIVNSVHPFALSSANIAWNDLNGNELPDPGELGTFEGFTGGASTRYPDADGTDWGYSDEITAGLEHQLMRDVRVGVMYYHRTNRKNVGSFNAAVPTTAYTPIQIASPLGGTATVYNLDRAFVGRQDNVRMATPLLDTDYDGVEVTAAKRFSSRWQMLFGLTVGRNEGGLEFGDLNDPNSLDFQEGVSGNDATYQLKLSGTYVVPRAEIIVSGSLMNSTGYPRQFTYQVTRSVVPTLTRSAQTIRLNRRGDERLPRVTMADLRFSRSFSLGGDRRFEPQVDLFNVFNADTIVNMVDAAGPRLGYPGEILAPRIMRVGFVFKF